MINPWSAFKDHLREGHVAIMESLDQIQAKMRLYQEAKPRIREFEGKLFSHFGQQNTQLFEQLAQYFQHDHEKIKNIEFLKIDLRDMKVKTLLFFDQFPADLADIHPVHFPKSFMDFSRELRLRIKIEEEYFLPLLEEISFS